MSSGSGTRFSVQLFRCISRCTIFRCCLDVPQVALQVWQQLVCFQVCQQQLLVCLLVWACQRKESKRIFHFYTGFTCWIAGAPGSQQKEWQRQPAQCTVIMVGLVWYKPGGEAASCLLLCRGVKLWPRLTPFYPHLAPRHSRQKPLKLVHTRLVCNGTQRIQCRRAMQKGCVTDSVWDFHCLTCYKEL